MLPKKLIYIGLLFYFVCTSIQAQVGINTTDPKGILDVNSSSYGIVLPRISLSSTQNAAPVTNPQGGNLAVGTVIYNTNTTSTGTHDVVPGIYVWTGSEWFAKFTKKDAQLFTQSMYTRPASNAGYEAITGLTGQSFTAKYTGTYKIEVSVNYGAGYAEDNDSDTDVISVLADFRFNFDGTDYNIPLSSWSVQGSTRYYLIWEQSNFVMYTDLVAGTSYNFDLHIDQQDATGMENNGNSGDGLGYTGYDIPCSVEFIFIGD